MLTSEEAKWLKKLQKVLNECPSERLGFFTTGDPSITVYDSTNEKSWDDTVDFPVAVDRNDAWLGGITFPNNVVATVG